MPILSEINILCSYTQYLFVSLMRYRNNHFFGRPHSNKILINRKENEKAGDRRVIL